MPRSGRMSGYANAVMEEEEEVICPYNKQHRIPVSLIQQHLAVCRKGLQGRNGSDIKICPYNRSHQVSAAKYDEHLENCPDASFEDNGYERESFEKPDPRKRRNGQVNNEARGADRYENETKARSSNLKHNTDGRHVEQFAAPKGCKIGKGFGFTKEQDTGNFVRERSLRNPKTDNTDQFDDSASNGSRRKPYGRSKSNLDMDEDSIRRAQRSVVDQVREFQTAFSQRASASRDDEPDRFTRMHEEGFTKLRDQAPFGKQQAPQQQQWDLGYEEPPAERRGYGRGRRVVENEEPQRPGGIWSRNRSEDEYVQPEFKEEPFMNRDTTSASSRFKIMKASKVFGPIEAAVPATFGEVGKRFSSTLEEEDWGSGEKIRTFAILKPSDVFRLDDFDTGNRRGRREDGNYFREQHGHDSFARPTRHFEVKHPEEVFSNGRQAVAPRFARSRTPPEVRETKKPELPWPFNRFAENPELGKRNEEESKVQESAVDDDKFPKAEAIARMSPMGRTSEVRSPTSPIGNGNGDEDEVRSYGHSECEIMSMSSGGGRTKRLNSESPFSHAWDRDSSETSDLPAAAATKPKVLSIYEQYEQFGLDDDDLNFLKPAEPIEPLILPDPNMGAIFAHLRNFGLGPSPIGVVQSPAFGSSHSSSPYSFAP